MRDLAHVNLMPDAERQLFSGRQGRLRRLRALEFAAAAFIACVQRVVPSGPSRAYAMRQFRHALREFGEAIKEENKS